jgi:hypothetical protein
VLTLPSETAVPDFGGVGAFAPEAVAGDGSADDGSVVEGSLVVGNGVVDEAGAVGVAAAVVGDVEPVASCAAVFVLLTAADTELTNPVASEDNGDVVLTPRAPALPEPNRTTKTVPMNIPKARRTNQWRTWTRRAVLPIAAS